MKRVLLFLCSFLIGFTLFGQDAPKAVNDKSTQADWDHWPWFEEVQIDNSYLRGPISILHPNGDQVLLYLAFAPEDAPEALWKGPRDCSAQTMKFTCTGKFLGWAAFELRDGTPVVQQVWLITRTQVKPQA